MAHFRSADNILSSKIEPVDKQVAGGRVKVTRVGASNDLRKLAYVNCIRFRDGTLWGRGLRNHQKLK